MSLATPPVDPDHEQRTGYRPTAPRGDRTPPPTTVPSPGARISRRDLGRSAGAVFTVAGDVGAHDAAIISRCLHAELAATGPATRVIVVDLTDVEAYGSELVNLLAVAEERAHSLAVGLHLLDLGHSGLRHELEARRSHRPDEAAPRR